MYSGTVESDVEQYTACNSEDEVDKGVEGCVLFLSLISFIFKFFFHFKLHVLSFVPQLSLIGIGFIWLLVAEIPILLNPLNVKPTNWLVQLLPTN